MGGYGERADSDGTDVNSYLWCPWWADDLMLMGAFWVLRGCPLGPPHCIIHDSGKPCGAPSPSSSPEPDSVPGTASPCNSATGVPSFWQAALWGGVLLRWLSLLPATLSTAILLAEKSCSHGTCPPFSVVRALSSIQGLR